MKARRYFIILSGAIVLSSCVGFDSGPPYGYNDKTRTFPDTPENRKFFLMLIEQDLQAELKDKVLGTAKSRDDLWIAQFAAIRRSDDNPEFYIGYFHKRRKELGLHRISGI